MAYDMWASTRNIRDGRADMLARGPTGTSSRIISPLRLLPALMSYSRLPPGSSNWTLIDSRFTSRFNTSTISLKHQKARASRDTVDSTSRVYVARGMLEIDEISLGRKKQTGLPPTDLCTMELNSKACILPGTSDITRKCMHICTQSMVARGPSHTITHGPTTRHCP